jgi:hypothetical protein
MHYVFFIKSENLFFCSSQLTDSSDMPVDSCNLSFQIVYRNSLFIFLFLFPLADSKEKDSKKKKRQSKSNDDEVEENDDENDDDNEFTSLGDASSDASDSK